jgi:hypothetical protein
MAFPGPDDFNPSSMTGGSFVLFVLTYFFGRRSAWRFLVMSSKRSVAGAGAEVDADYT